MAIAPVVNRPHVQGMETGTHAGNRNDGRFFCRIGGWSDGDFRTQTYTWIGIKEILQTGDWTGSERCGRTNKKASGFCMTVALVVFGTDI